MGDELGPMLMVMVGLTEEEEGNVVLSGGESGIVLVVKGEVMIMNDGKAEGAVFAEGVGVVSAPVPFNRRTAPAVGILEVDMSEVA